MNYTKLFNMTQTPQTQPIPGRTGMTPNAGGGYVFLVDCWTRLDRWLLLGTEGGTYYVGEKKLTKQNMEAVFECIKKDGCRVVRTVVEVSVAGRAPKNDPALFVLAACAKTGDEQTRAAANKALPEVARIGTHLFHYMQFLTAFGGRGSGTHRALQAWYNGKAARDLAYQVVKYQSRDGWSHRDVLRLARPKPVTDEHRAIYRWATRGAENELQPIAVVPEPLRIIWAFESMKRATSLVEVVNLITQYKLPHECVMNEWKGKPEVWAALLPHMGLTAVVRNLGKMTAVGLLTGMGDATKIVLDKFADAEQLRKAKLHPLAVLLAMRTYAQGHGEKGHLVWGPVGSIVDGLNNLFYETFQYVEPTGKRICLALDVSGSMDALLTDSTLTVREGAAALAMVNMRVEERTEILGFTSGERLQGRHWTWNDYITQHGSISRLPLSPKQRLDDIVKYVGDLTFGGTDCALPMLWALKNKVPVDAFVILTDSETWAGAIHPMQALKKYRQQMNIPAKLICVGMTATHYSVADENDQGCLNVVGFDAAAPAIISDFIRG